MKQVTKDIIAELQVYLIQNPNVRFTQALFNLGINQFADETNPEKKEYLFKDNHNTSDVEILDRVIKNRI